MRDPAATEDSLIELLRARQNKVYRAGYLGVEGTVRIKLA